MNASLLRACRNWSDAPWKLASSIISEPRSIYEGTPAPVTFPAKGAFTAPQSAAEPASAAPHTTAANANALTAMPTPQNIFIKLVLSINHRKDTNKREQNQVRLSFAVHKHLSHPIQVPFHPVHINPLSEANHHGTNHSIRRRS